MQAIAPFAEFAAELGDIFEVYDDRSFAMQSEGLLIGWNEEHRIDRRVLLRPSTHFQVARVVAAKAFVNDAELVPTDRDAGDHARRRE